MTILIVASRFPSHIRTGDRLRVYYLAREFARAGHTVDLAGFDAADAPLDCDIAAHCREMRRIPVEDIEFRRTRTPANALRFLRAAVRLYPHRVLRLRSRAMREAVERLLAERRYDVVHFSEEIVGATWEAVAPALRERGTPAVVDFIDPMSCSVLRSLRGGFSLLAPARLVSALLLRRYELRMLRGMRAATLVAERDRRALGGPPGLRVIPNGVDIPPEAPAVRKGIDLLFVGNFESASNRDAMRWFLAEVWPALLERMPAATLTVVGPNPPAFLASLPSPQVAVTGEVPSTAPYYRRAKLAVAPMRHGAGIKNKILEAFAFGVPVAATPEANEGVDAPGDAIALADDARGMALVIDELLRDDRRREAMAERARAFVRERYTWEGAARSFLDLYEQLIAGQG